MKHPPKGGSFFCQACQLAVLMVVAILAFPYSVAASMPEDGFSGINSQIGKNDLKRGNPANPRTVTFAYEEPQ